MSSLIIKNFARIKTAFKALSFNFSINDNLHMIGVYFTEDLLQSWFVENLSVARALLQKFKLLDQLLDGFKQYETKRYHDTRNIVLHMCLPEIKGTIKSADLRMLGDLEKGLEWFGVMSWHPKKLAHLKSRLSSDDYYQSLSAFTELIVAKRLVDRLGRENVELYPRLKSGGFSDVVVKVNGKEVYLEVGNLGKSLPENKIQRIIDASAKHLGEQIDTPCYLQVEINTAELEFDNEGRIDVGASITKLNSEIDMLSLQKLAGFNGWFAIESIADTLANQPLYARFEQMLTPRNHELLDLVKSEKIRDWLSCFGPSLLKKAKLVTSVIGGTTSNLLAEIHTRGVFPSEAAISERKSFLNHIVRNVETQMGEQQLQPGSANIIIVQGYHWIFFNFETGILGLEPLYERIWTFLNEKREGHLSGIAFFSAEFEGALYISNNYASESSLLSREDIAKLGLRWLELRARI